LLSDLQVSVWTVGRYLRAWGLTRQKPVLRAYEQKSGRGAEMAAGRISSDSSTGTTV